MEQLGALADEMTPVFTDLGAVAPDINRFLLELGPFSQAAIPAFDTLGDAAVVGTPAIRTATPVLQDTQTLAAKTKPVAKLLAERADLVPGATTGWSGCSTSSSTRPPRSTASTRSATTCARR